MYSFIDLLALLNDFKEGYGMSILVEGPRIFSWQQCLAKIWLLKYNTIISRWIMLS